MLRALAVTMLVAFAPLAARAQSYDYPSQPPEKFGRLNLKFEGKLYPGYWYSDQQILVIHNRIEYLEKKAAKECVDQQIGSYTPNVPVWVWVTTGIVIGVAAGILGVVAWDKSHSSTSTTPASTATPVP